MNEKEAMHAMVDGKEVKDYFGTHIRWGTNQIEYCSEGHWYRGYTMPVADDYSLVSPEPQSTLAEVKRERDKFKRERDYGARSYETTIAHSQERERDLTLRLADVKDQRDTLMAEVTKLAASLETWGEL